MIDSPGWKCRRGSADIYLSSLLYISVLSQVGIIGGSGLDDPDILEQRAEKAVETPYGKVLIYCNLLIVGSCFEVHFAIYTSTAL